MPRFQENDKGTRIRVVGGKYEGRTGWLHKNLMRLMRRSMWFWLHKGTNRRSASRSLKRVSNLAINQNPCSGNKLWCNTRRFQNITKPSLPSCAKQSLSQLSKPLLSSGMTGMICTSPDKISLVAAVLFVSKPPLKFPGVVMKITLRASVQRSNKHIFRSRNSTENQRRWYEKHEQ